MQWNSPDRRYHVSRYHASARTLILFLRSKTSVSCAHSFNDIHYSSYPSVLFCKAAGFCDTKHDPNFFKISSYIHSTPSFSSLVYIDSYIIITMDASLRERWNEFLLTRRRYTVPGLLWLYNHVYAIGANLAHCNHSLKVITNGAIFVRAKLQWSRFTNVAWN